MKAILVAGTWEYERPGEWVTPESPFVAFLKQQGIDPCFADGRPFQWSTDLGGVGFGDRDLNAWRSAGVNLLAYAVPPLCPEMRIPSSELILLTHSHGLQVALSACARGLKCSMLVDIAGPVRRDMADVAAQARPNIGRWVHVFSDGSDRWQWFGELGDGRWWDWFKGDRIARAHPLADVNDCVPGVGHSTLVRDPAQFHHWTDRQWLSLERV